MPGLSCTCDIALDLKIWQQQHKADTKADTQPDDGREQAALKLHEESEKIVLVHLGKCCDVHLRSKSCSTFLHLHIQLFLLVTRGLTKVSRRVHFAPSLPELESSSLCSLGDRFDERLSVDMDMTDSLVDGMLDVGRMTVGGKIVVFAFVLGDENLKMECK